MKKLKCKAWAGAFGAIALATLPPPTRAAEAAFPDAAALRKLDHIVGDKTIVVFGEDSHGMAEVHALAPVLFEHLVKTKGFRLFVFEASWGLEEALQPLIDGSVKEPGGSQSFFLNAFNSPPILDMLRWIGAWNRAHPDDPVRIAGYQPEQPVTDARAILAYFAAVKPGEKDDAARLLEPCKAGATRYASDIAFIGELAQARRKAKTPGFTADEREACLKSLAALAERIGDGRGRTEVEARLHVLSLRTYVDLLSRILDDSMQPRSVETAKADNGRMYEVGDRTRYEILEGLRQTRYRNAKAFLWMHNWHAMRDSRTVDMAGAKPVSIGARIAAGYPKSTVSIVNIVPCGTECQDPPEGLERTFAAKYGDRPAIIDFRDRADAKGLALDTSGVLIPNFHASFGGGFGGVVLRQQFDAAVYLPKATALR